jgi:hypothetical protein
MLATASSPVSLRFLQLSRPGTDQKLVWVEAGKSAADEDIKSIIEQILIFLDPTTSYLLISEDLVDSNGGYARLLIKYYFEKN